MGVWFGLVWSDQLTFFFFCFASVRSVFGPATAAASLADDLLRPNQAAGPNPRCRNPDRTSVRLPSPPSPNWHFALAGNHSDLAWWLVIAARLGKCQLRRSHSETSFRKAACPQACWMPVPTGAVASFYIVPTLLLLSFSRNRPGSMDSSSLTAFADSFLVPFAR